MPLITRLAQQKKDHERVNLYLDGKFAFGITLESVLQKSLKSGLELTLEQVEDLKTDGDYAKILNKVLNFATRRPHSEREIMHWFRRKKLDKEKDTDKIIIEKIITKLKNLKLIDDLEFAKWWVEQRSAFRPKGKNALKAELAQKGIAREIVEEVLGEIGTETEVETAKKLAEKRITRLSGLEPRDQKRKLLEFLARRGFSYDIANSAIDEIARTED